MMPYQNDGTTVFRVSFLHLLHPNICLQADEKVQAQRRADDPKDVDPKDVESEAHGPERESLSGPP